MSDYFKQSVSEADIHYIVSEIVAFTDCIKTRQMLLGALQLPLSIGGDLEQKYRLDGCSSYGYFTGVISKWVNLKGKQASTVELDKALRDIGWNAPADNVKDKWLSRPVAAAEVNTQNVSKSKQLDELIWFNMRDPISSFTGREDTLEQVHNIFFPTNVGQQDKSDGKIKSTQVAIVGLGGIGKSEFARKFATVYYTEFNVAWINAETAQLVVSSFKELAADIGIDTTNVTSEKQEILKLIKRVYEHFSKSNSLFIFDNVEAWFEGEDAIKDYLPKGLKPSCKTPYILMTSRNRPKVSTSVAIVELSVLMEPEAVQLIQHRLGTENSDFPLQLAKLLGCLPLALQQAISYIQQEIEEDISEMARQEVVAKCILSYIEIFDTEAKKLLDYKDGDFDADFEELKTTWITWRITLQKIRILNSSAIPLLTLMSYISSDDIHLKMFEEQFPVDDLKAAVSALVRFSMITRISTVVSVHRLVQRVVRVDYEDKQEGTLWDENDKGKSLESVLNLLNIILVELPSKITPYSTSCVNHALTAWEHALAHHDLLIQFEDYPGNLYNKAELHGMYQTILPILERTISKYKEYNINRESDKQYLQVQQIILAALVYLHRYDDAKLMCQIIHKTAADALGESDPLTLSILSALAVAESGLRNHSEQMIIHDKLIAVYNASPYFGPYHIDTLASLMNKAACLATMLKFDEALDLFKSTLELIEEHHPENHRLIQNTRHWIAKTTLWQGNFAEALQMFKNLHSELVKSFGESHTSTLQCAQKIGDCLLNLGKYEEAMEVLKHNLNLPNNSPAAQVDCVNMKYSIARVLLEMKRFDEAISQFRIVLGERISIFGETHPDVLSIKEWLADALQKAGRTDEALQHYEFVYEYWLEALGAEHPDTIKVKEKIEYISTACSNLGHHHKDMLTSLHQKAVCLADMRKYDEALELFRSALELKEKHPLEDRKSINETRSWIAHMTRWQGNFAEALPIYRSVHAELVESFGKSHIDTLHCAIGTGACLLELGKYEEAIEVLKYNIEYANDNPIARIECVNMKYSIATALFEMERYDEAISQFRIVWDEESNIYGETHPDVLTTRVQLADALQKASRTGEAMDHYIYVYENRANTLGVEHPDTKRVKGKMENISNALPNLGHNQKDKLRILLDDDLDLD